MLTCTRRLQWCMGHRVYGHENKCGHMHGHNYVGFFTAQAPELDNKGRVIDFAVLKERIGGWIDYYWDHGFVLFAGDPAVELIRGCPDVPGGTQKMFLMGMNPTAENLALLLGDYVCPEVLANTGVQVTKIVLYETENGIATWEK